MADNEVLYDSLAHNRASIVGWRRAFSDGLFSASVSPGSTFFVVQMLRVWHRATAALLDNIARDRGDVVVVLLELRWTPRRLHISSTAAMDYSDFPVGIAVRTLLFERIFEKFEDLGVVHVGDQILRLFAELVDLIRLAQVLKEGFLVLVVLKLLDQLLDLVFRLRLFQDSDFEGDLEDSKSTSGRVVCIFWKSNICTDQLDVHEANVSVSQLHRIRNHFVGGWFANGRKTCARLVGFGY